MESKNNLLKENKTLKMIQYIGTSKKLKTYGEVNDKVYVKILKVGRDTVLLTGTLHVLQMTIIT